MPLKTWFISHVSPTDILYIPKGNTFQTTYAISKIDGMTYWNMTKKYACRAVRILSASQLSSLKKNCVFRAYKNAGTFQFTRYDIVELLQRSP